MELIWLKASTCSQEELWGKKGVTAMQSGVTAGKIGVTAMERDVTAGKRGVTLFIHDC